MNSNKTQTGQEIPEQYRNEKFFNWDGVYYYKGKPCRKVDSIVLGNEIDHYGDRWGSFAIYDSGYIAGYTMAGIVNLQYDLADHPEVPPGTDNKTAEEVLRDELNALCFNNANNFQFDNPGNYPAILRAMEAYASSLLQNNSAHPLNEDWKEAFIVFYKEIFPSWPEHGYELRDWISQNVPSQGYSSEQVEKILVAALWTIANPVRYLSEEAEKKSENLNGVVAIQLANDANWLKSIAQKALDAWSQTDQGKELLKL